MSRFEADGVRTKRRRIGGVFLAIGFAAVVATASKDYPREQTIVFRLPDPKSVTLIASFTKVGEAEARTGFTLSLADRVSRDVSHTIRVPDGDYIVTIELRRPTSARTFPGTDAGPGDETAAPALARAEETSVSRRVSLTGSEVVVPVPARSE
jgi:hypothetical protein